MSELSPAIVDAFFSGAALGHLTTINPDGSPHTTVVWVAVEDGDVVCAHLSGQYKKLRNLARDPRVSISVELPTTSPMGLRHYVVVEGTAKLHEGGAGELLQELAHRHLGPDVVFPGPDAPPGFVLHTTPTKVRGVYPE